MDENAHLLVARPRDVEVVCHLTERSVRVSDRDPPVIEPLQRRNQARIDSRRGDRHPLSIAPAESRVCDEFAPFLTLQPVCCYAAAAARPATFSDSRSASTTAGSNCVPRFLTSSAIASSRESAFRYERSVVIAL